MQGRASSQGRRALTWLLSIVGGGLFLWLASTKLRLFPEELTIVSSGMLLAAALLHLPYAVVRALRLQFVLDPVVEGAGEGPRFDRRVLYGSGFLSFLVLLVLPLKLGELSRPLLLARGRQSSVRLTEAVTAVGLERVVDGLLICAMLFGGLAFAHDADATASVQVRHVGRVMLLVIAGGLAMLLVAARNPARARSVAGRIAALGGPSIQARVEDFTERLALAVAGVLDLRRAVAFVGWSAAYWAITALQLWLVLRASGIELGAAEASAIVAIIGLSIQLPGGPAQAGTFQVGAALALGLFLSEEGVAGPGSTFAALMYLLQFAGAALVALPGAVLMAKAAPRQEPENGDKQA